MAKYGIFGGLAGPWKKEKIDKVIGGGALIVTLTNDNGTWTSDVEPSDIVAAFEDGKSVYVKARGYNCPVLFAGGEGVDIAIMSEFSMVTSEDDGHYLIYINASYDNQSWSVDYNDPIPLENIPFEVEGTLGKDADQKTTLTLDKTAEELYAATSQGRMVKITAPISEGGGATMEFICSIFTIKQTIDNVALYTFDFISSSMVLAANEIAAQDTVVFVEE